MMLSGCWIIFGACCKITLSKKQIGQLRKELADLPFGSRIKLSMNNPNYQEEYKVFQKNNQSSFALQPEGKHLFF